MRFALLLTCGFLSSIFCCAQNDKVNKWDSVKVTNAYIKLYELENDKDDHASVSLPFSNISFTDVRFDTSFVCINWKINTLTTTLNGKFSLEGGLAAGLTGYFNRYYSTNFTGSDKELVCYIKSFSMAYRNEFVDNFNNDFAYFDKVEHEVKAEIECYYKTGGKLYPAARLDTTYFTQFLKRNRSEFTDAIKEMVAPLMQKIEHTSVDNVLKRTPYTVDQVTQRYNKRFEMPVLLDTVYKKGVYKSFAEFKANTPSIDSFSIATDKMLVNSGNTKMFDVTSLLYRAFQKRNTTVFLYDENEKLISPSEVFGFCDGTTFWIQHGAFYYPLVRVDHAFEFMYIFHYADSNSRTNTFYLLMALDMDTGMSK